ncbi:hypothetical protein Mgra_00008380 [Meloidogyne graminicola]|uniref:Transmembrane protein n=1 Tax=Meloidogyne graminicola TaxID=189291 RepID=A0A8S9ZFY7_9BILA|nr:hypothetical protein Mgra_00008380 [Meloidogyne graminicola]
MPQSSNNSQKSEIIQNNKSSKNNQNNSFIKYLIIYFLLNLFFIYQLIVYIQNHNHLGGLIFWDTAFLLIVNLDPKFPPLKWIFTEYFKKDFITKLGSESQPLIQIIGVVVFQALLFVNFTHSIEAIFCDDSK